MPVHALVRLALIAMILSVAYYYLLIYSIGWMGALSWPGWWLAIFPTRHSSVMTWLVTIHTVAVLSAALPVGAAAVLMARKNAVQVALIASSLATVAALLPSLTPALWPLIWNNHPLFFVTDQIKLIAAVPFVAWVLRGAPSNNRFERSRGVASMSQGVGR